MRQSGPAPEAPGSVEPCAPIQWYRTPFGTYLLPNHHVKFFNLLLEIRREEGDVDAIAPTYTYLAERYGCCRGHMIRLLAEFANAYTFVTIEKPTSSFRVIRFNLNLAGIDAPPSTGERFTPSRARRDQKSRARRAQQAELPLVDACPLSVAPGATQMVAPGAPPIISKNLEFEEITLQDVRSAPEMPQTDASDPPTTEAADDVPASIETPESRQARLEAHWQLLPATEQEIITAEVVTLSPRLARVAPGSPAENSRRLGCLGILERRHPDLYPPIDTEPAPRRQAEPRPVTLADRIRALPKADDAEVASVVAAMVAELDDANFAANHRKAVAEIRAGRLEPARVVKWLADAKAQTSKPAGLHFGVSLKFHRESLGGKEKNRPPVHRGSLPADGPKGCAPTRHNYR